MFLIKSIIILRILILQFHNPSIMSKDDTILIVKILYNGKIIYKIIWCMAAENFYNSEDWKLGWEWLLWTIEDNIEKYNDYSYSYSEALEIANKMNRKKHTEYGIKELNDYENKEYTIDEVERAKEMIDNLHKDINKGKNIKAAIKLK